MMHYKKLLAVLVVFAMVFSFTPSLVRAEEKDVTSAGTADELAAALAAGGTVALSADIALAQMIEVPSGVTATLDLNGHNITVAWADEANGKHIYALNNKGNLTLQDSVGTGSIAARGIYNGYDGSNTANTVEGAKLTVLSGKYIAQDTSGGAAIFNCAELIIRGGTFEGVVAAVNSREKGTATIYNGMFRSVSNYAIQNNGGKMTIHNASVDAGFGAVGCFGGTTTIFDGTYLPTGKAANTCHVVYVSGTATVDIRGGTFKMNYPAEAVPDSGSAITSYYNGTLTISGGTFTSHFDNVSPIELSAGATVTGGTYLIHSGTPSSHTYITTFLAENYTLTNGVVALDASIVAKVGSVYYQSLQEAFDAAQKDDVITLCANVALSDTTLTLAAGKTVTLDLAGYTISGVCNASQASMIIVANTATLTIKDSSEPSTGKITYGTGTSNVGFALDVKGNLILDSGTIELTGSWSLGFAVDVRPNAWGTAYTESTTFVMNGGKVVSSDTAVRVDSNSSNQYEKLGVYFTMNGGAIESDWDAVFIQHRYANDLYVTIHDGMISGKNSPLRIYGDTVVSNVYVELNGGTFDYTGEAGGTWLVENFLKGTASVVAEADITITGGRYENVDTQYVAEGYSAVKVDDYYVVHKHDSLTDIPAKEATCTETGLTAGKKCSVCGTITVAQTVLLAKDHTEVDLPAKEATCTETGLTTGKKCSVCGTITVAQTVVEKKSHSLTPIPATAATYFAPGNLAYYVCSTCDKLFADAEGAKEVTLEEVSLAQLVKIEDTTADVSTDVVEDIIKDAADAGTTDIVITVTQDKLADDNKEDTPADPNPDEGDTDAGEPAPEPETAPVVTKTQLPVAAVQQVADLHEEATLTINMTNATVTMDKTTLDVVTEKAKTEQTDVIALEIEHIEEEQLAPAQQTAVAKKTVAAVISASILVNDKEVHDFEGGKVTVAIPFQMDAGTVASDYVVLYIADDGSVEEIPSTIADSKLVMTLSHFSEYVVVNTTVAKDPTNPGTGEGFDIGMMLFLMVASAAAIVIVSNKKRFAQ